MVRRSLLFLSLISLIGCIRHVVPPDRRARRPPPEKFDHAKGRGFVLTRAASTSPAYELAILTFPALDRSDPKNPTVRAELRRPPHGRGLVLVIPILGGDYEAENVFAEHLAEIGFATLRFDRRVDVFDPEKDFAHVARSIRNAIVDIRRSLEWPEVQPLVSQGVGIVGISMGSFMATGVAATDQRVGASVLALGGSGLVDIIYSARGEWEIARFFDGLEKRGWSAEKIRADAHRHLDPLDPERFAGAIDPDSMLLVHARFDAVVPYSHGTQLWEAAGKPPRVTLLSGHYTAALYLPWLLQMTADHFQRRLR